MLIFFAMICVRTKSCLARQSRICSSISSTFSRLSIVPYVSTCSSSMIDAAPVTSPSASLMSASILVKRARSTST
uniref:Putative secreted peptide n=1 Tax=Anopheles braziliensis TaxID=58242 RepID=A0A2M3ZSU8_9DIPT